MYPNLETSAVLPMSMWATRLSSEAGSLTVITPVLVEPAFVGYTVR